MPVLCCSIVRVYMHALEFCPLNYWYVLAALPPIASSFSKTFSGWKQSKVCSFFRWVSESMVSYKEGCCCFAIGAITDKKRGVVLIPSHSWHLNPRSFAQVQLRFCVPRSTAKFPHIDHACVLLVPISFLLCFYCKCTFASFIRIIAYTQGNYCFLCVNFENTYFTVLPYCLLWFSKLIPLGSIKVKSCYLDLG